MAATPGKPPAAAPAGRVTIKLSKPIVAYGETKTELTFREPTGDDVMQHGYPISLRIEDSKNRSGSIVINRLEMADMIGALAGVPPSSLKPMAMEDYMRCTGVISDFFMPSIVAQYSNAILT